MNPQAEELKKTGNMHFNKGEYKIYFSPESQQE